jgi:hypothetical protein
MMAVAGGIKSGNCFCRRDIKLLSKFVLLRRLLATVIDLFLYLLVDSG